ncbi:1-acyl-sn-glycerol-3-phosphate acyltransferase [bacterium]|nr:1-acyl-sn-glycerol-3-phosphate acyltransferase [bacterium]
MVARNYQKRTANEYNVLRGAFQWLTCNVFAIYYKLAFNLKVEGRENVPKHTFFIVASNHVSANDPFLVIYAIKKRVAYMAKIELFKNIVRRFFLNTLGAFAVDRSKLAVSTVKTILELKETGWAFGIFPQGTRQKEGDLTIVNKGFAIFAKILKCAILPVAITGVEKDKRKFFKDSMKVKIGKPIPYNDNVDEMISVWSKEIEKLMEGGCNEQ